ncbi:toprim domain-containing protein [Cellulophaga tyrosinoxydans]|uniref:Toprim-like n=1 Tax=Cellulophaga tyrosinoxydans TaxID=504486 RepID=A0A1W1YUZ3_9FLAO|nr:toprim domain-containing protein [Cellulophaga tyrosinoxydans]SMC39902.1 Toprim-like [Cellulophaga tyrosinoxydans]
MTRKRTNKISCERARAFSIEKTLAKLGHFPTITNEKEAWFLSPFRSETQASFKVCKKLNSWYDHGAGKGGNVIDLICLVNKLTVKEVLAWLDKNEISFFLHQQPILKKEKQKDYPIVIHKIKELQHNALEQYLVSRNISIRIAKKIIKEVHYQFKDKKYFAIGLQNDSGGWELRNKYLKNGSSPKDITHLKNGQSKLMVTEGMFDLLSILETDKRLETQYDFLVMNSISFLEKVKLISVDYSLIELYLDNDTNGGVTTQNLIKGNNRFIDKSSLYHGFKDVNDWLMHRAQKGFDQKAQDVFLLPQKQTCFTPDGCKENEK